MKTLTFWTCLMLAATPAAASTSWITAGDAAYQKIRKIQPRAKVLGSSVPAIAGAEKLHLIEVKTAHLDKLSARLHRELRHCGGFMYHASESDDAVPLRCAMPLPSGH